MQAEVPKNTTYTCSAKEDEMDISLFVGHKAQQIPKITYWCRAEHAKHFSSHVHSTNSITGEVGFTPHHCHDFRRLLQQSELDSSRSRELQYHVLPPPPPTNERSPPRVVTGLSVERGGRCRRRRP